MWTLEARTFGSMVDNGDSWAVLLDWDEALCYALVRAQCTGIKHKIQKSTLTKGAWYVYSTGQGAARPGVEKKLSRLAPRNQRNH